MASDPNTIATIGACAIIGIGAVFAGIRSLRTDVQTMVIESTVFREVVEKIFYALAKSDVFRDIIKKVISETCTGHASASEVAVLGSEVKMLKKIAKLPETTCLPRSEVHA